MSISLTEDQIALQQMAREFAIKEIAPVITKEREQSGEFPWELYQKMFDAGYSTMGLPEEYGGGGLSIFEQLLINEQLSQYGDVGFLASCSSGEMAFGPILNGGTEEQKRYYGKYIQEGKIAAFALTEPESGSDAASIRTSAVRDGDEYVLNGTKCFVTSGGLASIYTILATVDRSKGYKGITCFMVERDRPGLTVGKEEDKMGFRMSNTVDLILEDVRVPVDHRIGEEGQGFYLAMKNLDRTRPIGSIGAIAIAQAAIDHTVRYTKVRKTFGKPIIENQAVQHILADMQIKTTAARHLCYNAARMIDEGVLDSELGSITKTFCSDIAMEVTTDAVQLFGGYGYCKDYPVEKLFRDAKLFAIFEGANQIQRNVIAKKMMKRIN